MEVVSAFLLSGETARPLATVRLARVRNQRLMSIVDRRITLLVNGKSGFFVMIGLVF
jgi:hypothetical protein